MIKAAGNLLHPARHDNSAAPSLHGHYPTSSQLRTAPTPDVPARAVMSSHAASGARPRARRVSQVPRPICHCAPSAPTPTGRTGAYADVFPARAGFSISGSLATCNLRNEADLGSTFDGLRLTASLSTAFDRFARCPRRTGLAPRASLPPRDRPQLHVSSAFHMAVTSQTARRARLVLAHQRRKGKKENSSLATVSCSTRSLCCSYLICIGSLFSSLLFFSAPLRLCARIFLSVPLVSLPQSVVAAEEAVIHQRWLPGWTAAESRAPLQLSDFFPLLPRLGLYPFAGKRVDIAPHSSGGTAMPRAFRNCQTLTL